MKKFNVIDFLGFIACIGNLALSAYRNNMELCLAWTTAALFAANSLIRNKNK